MILLETIKTRLEKYVNYDIIYKDFDCRYMDKWIRLYPDCFPKYVLNGNFTTFFNPNSYRWEILKGIHTIEFNPKNYI